MSKWIASGAAAAERLYTWFAGVEIGDTLDNASFSPKQTKLLQIAFQESFTHFSKAIDSRLREIEEHVEMKSTAMRGEEVTGPLAATSLVNHNISKNQRRKLRRKRTKEKLVVQRSMVLQMRPSTDISRVSASPRPEPVQSANSSSMGLNERIAGLEESVTMLQCCFNHEWQYSHVYGTPADMGISAIALADQCHAVRCIQRAWTRYKERVRRLVVVPSIPDPQLLYPGRLFHRLPSVGTWLSTPISNTCSLNTVANQRDNFWLDMERYACAFEETSFSRRSWSVYEECHCWIAHPISLELQESVQNQVGEKWSCSEALLWVSLAAFPRRRFEDSLTGTHEILRWHDGASNLSKPSYVKEWQSIKKQLNIEDDEVLYLLRRASQCTQAECRVLEEDCEANR